ncbi:endonuclease/exonuclease/phosphatase family protein [Planctomycetaceae bacterium SH139]
MPMHTVTKIVAGSLLLCLTAPLLRAAPPPEFSPAEFAASESAASAPDGAERTTIRVATINASLYRDSANQLTEELEAGTCHQAGQLAALLQVTRPDVVLINELDYRADHRAVKSLINQYLHVAQVAAGRDLQPLDYPYFFSGPVNTGVDSKLDLNADGHVGSADDAWGYGRYPGQYGMAVLSRFPIDSANVRSFQKFRWSSLPRAKRPVVPATGKPFHDDATWQRLRLSSKSHWDVPIKVNAWTLHILASHPTPPAFDGPEKRNVRRNHDEIQFWAHYIDPQANFAALVDDNGRAGGLAEDANFVILGDLNSDPRDGSGMATAINGLLNHKYIQDPNPTSRGGPLAARNAGGVNAKQLGDPALDTSQFSAKNVGNLRVDYCLPSANLKLSNSGVFWPAPDQSEAPLVEFTDHRLVWIDIVPPQR